MTRANSLWNLAAEIRKADKRQAEAVARLIAAERSLEAGLDRLEAIYRDISPARAAA